MTRDTTAIGRHLPLVIGVVADTLGKKLRFGRFESLQLTAQRREDRSEHDCECAAEDIMR
jgi:hypothetical protein